ncbi:MAG: T9SS type A sorting domain-containing protein [Saprospiraceae bacterium]|nr:T9SS type A sorting domain-containing protein [Saprospiraceae bacterium]
MNNIDFTEIGKVDANGTSFVSCHYSFADLHPFKGTNYYRLKETSLDGQESFHTVIAVSVNHADDAIKIYPSHPQQALFVNPGKEKIDHLYLVATDGKIVSSQSYNLEEISSLDVSHLAKGTYILVIETQGKKPQSFKFIKS